MRFKDQQELGAFLDQLEGMGFSFDAKQGRNAALEGARGAMKLAEQVKSFGQRAVTD